MPIPAWTATGILPPFTGASPAQRAHCAPYASTIVEVVERFAHTSTRIDILNGFLRYREQLEAAGVRSGLIWIDGSFLEDVEQFRPTTPHPKDIDLVVLTSGNQCSLRQPAFAHLLNPDECKRRYLVDPYFIDTDEDPLLVARGVVYWYGLFSHQRQSFDWKGILELEVDRQHDGDAQRLLQQRAGSP